MLKRLKMDFLMFNDHSGSDWSASNWLILPSADESDWLGQLTSVLSIRLMVHRDLLLVVVGHLTIVLANFDVGELHGHNVLTQGLEDQVSENLETGILICQLGDS
jgi:hypothetical protein